MSQQNYEKLLHSINKLRGMLTNKTFYNPQLTRSKICCLVDDNFSLHALRCSKNSLEDRLAMENVEYALISEESPTTIQWQPLVPSVFYPAFPLLALREKQLFGTTIGLLKNDPENIHLSRYYAYLWSFSSEAHNFLATYPLALNSALKMVISPDNRLFFISTPWLPPVAIGQSHPLSLVSYQNQDFTILANPILGTDIIGNFPATVAMYISNKSEIHLIYDGYYKSPSPNGLKYLWHLKLDLNGKILAAEDLALAPKFPLLSEIFAAPNGSLYLLVIYFDESTRQTLEHTLIKIAGEERESDKSEYYFIDNWLQLHSVWFENDQAYYYGPDKTPFS